jgi:hypothetical protein
MRVLCAAATFVAPLFLCMLCTRVGYSTIDLVYKLLKSEGTCGEIHRVALHPLGHMHRALGDHQGLHRR